MAEISPLRRRMIEDMTVRNLSPATQQSYLSVVSKLSRYLGRSPDRLRLTIASCGLPPMPRTREPMRECARLGNGGQSSSSNAATAWIAPAVSLSDGPNQGRHLGVASPPSPGVPLSFRL